MNTPRIIYRYVCQDDDCGLIFRYSSGAYKQPEPPHFCPCCGKPGTVTVYKPEEN